MDADHPMCGVLIPCLITRAGFLCCCPQQGPLSLRPVGNYLVKGLLVTLRAVILPVTALIYHETANKLVNWIIHRIALKQAAAHRLDMLGQKTILSGDARW